MSDFISVLNFIADQVQLLVVTLQLSFVGNLIIFLMLLGIIVTCVISFRGGR